MASYCIQNKLKNKKLHLVVEPDKSIIAYLDKNIRNNLMECKIFNGIIDIKTQCFKQKGLGSFTYNCEESNIKIKSLYDVELDSKFNTLVVDCEGCFVSFFNNFKSYILQNITKIIIEVDRINHDKIFDILLNNNFKIVDNFFNHIIIFSKTI